MNEMAETLGEGFALVLFARAPACVPAGHPQVPRPRARPRVIVYARGPNGIYGHISQTWPTALWQWLWCG